jgi:hypothetical protein
MEMNLKGALAAVAAALLIVSCGGPGTDLKRTHFEPAFQKTPVSDILVIGVSQEENARLRFEKRFVHALKTAGVDAVGSAEAVAIPPDMKLQKEAILKAVALYGSDAVIVTHLVDIETKEAFNRAEASAADFYGYYGLWHSYQHDPGYSMEQTTVWLETHLYDAASESLIWSAESRSWNVQSERQVIADVIQEVVKNLLESGVVVPK